MAIARYVMRELMKEIGNKSREFYEFVLPPVDILEDGNDLLILIDMPGFEKSSINLRINENILTVKAKREAPEHLGTTYQQQRPLRIEKKIPLPVSVEVEREPKASYKDGVLEIRIPITGISTIKIE